MGANDGERRRDALAVRDETFTTRPIDIAIRR